MSAPAVTACPYCRAAVSGRFCSECGKSLDVDRSEGAVTRELLGIKADNSRAVANTAWLAIVAPETLSRRWCAGDRQELVSPVALLSIVGALAATVAVFATALTGNHAPGKADAAALGNVLDAMPFLRHWFAAGAAQAAADPADFSERLRQVGSWLVAAWPALFLLPGVIVLAPWRRISRHDALIVACVETVTAMALAGGYSVVRIALPGVASNPLFLTVLWLALAVHTARHVQRIVPGSSIVYAATRPILATLVFPVVIYGWMLAVTGLTLLLMPFLKA